jgi:hypothetical protein
MAYNSIVLKIFKDKSNLDDFRVYICSMTEKIIDIKNKILKDIFNSNGIIRSFDKFSGSASDQALLCPAEYNYLDFENISEKVYKDYGKLFFDKGLLPRTIDNYSLQDFTVEGRDFSFLCIPTNICEKSKLIHNNYSDSAGPRRACSDAERMIPRKKIKIESTYKTLQKNENKFIFNEDDFPPLK